MMKKIKLFILLSALFVIPITHANEILHEKSISRTEKAVSSNELSLKPSAEKHRLNKRLFEQAMQLMAQKKWSAAVDIFRKLKDSDSKNIATMNNLAAALFQVGEHTESRKIIEAAVLSQAEFKVAQENRQAIYNYLSAQAYDLALGIKKLRVLPKLTLLPFSEVDDSLVVEKIKSEQELNNKELQKLLKKWSEAWSKGDVRSYFSVYSPRFKPEKNIAADYKLWHRSRRIKLQRSLRPIIVIENEKIFIQNTAENSTGTLSVEKQAIIEFKQGYQSNRYSDVVIKQLQLVQFNGQWLIQAERVLEKLSH